MLPSSISGKAIEFSYDYNSQSFECDSYMLSSSMQLSLPLWKLRFEDSSLRLLIRIYHSITMFVFKAAVHMSYWEYA